MNSKKVHIEPTKITLKEFFERWLEDYAKTSLRETSYEIYHSYIHQHIIPELGSIPLQKLQPMHLQRFYNKQLKTGRVVVKEVWLHRPS